MPAPGTLRLGHADEASVPADPAACTAPYHDWTGRPGRFRGEANGAWLPLVRAAGRSVGELQRDLRTLGFYPRGPLDGVFGYRTQSAVRLFQEYAASVGGDPGIGVADGIAGRKTRARIAEWLAAGRRADWTPGDGLQEVIFKGLEVLRERFLAGPGPAWLDALNRFSGISCTRAVRDWRFDPAGTQLVGIRRADTEIRKVNGRFVRRNDDIFVLLVNGARFVFRGSTDPSPTMAARKDAAFLVPGQHEFRFGWHKLSTLSSTATRVYRAFKPRHPAGVLVVRADDSQLTPASYATGAEANATINIHWSGAGTSNWSAGCQVVAGKRYKNHKGEIVDLSATSSPGYADLGRKTRGAYNVLVDLVTVFADDLRCASGDTLPYTLLGEADLDELPGRAGIDFANLVAELS